jgi:hypothetical protein
MVDIDAIKPRDVIRDFPVIFEEGTDSKNRPIVVVIVWEAADNLSVFPIYTKNTYNSKYRCEIHDWAGRPDGSGAGLDHASYVDVSRMLIVNKRDLAGLDVRITGKLSDSDWDNVIGRFTVWRAEQQATGQF